MGCPMGGHANPLRAAVNLSPAGEPRSDLVDGDRRVAAEFGGGATAVRLALEVDFRLLAARRTSADYGWPASW
jgi:hypothetical protein